MKQIESFEDYEFNDDEIVVAMCRKEYQAIRAFKDYYGGDSE